MMKETMKTSVVGAEREILQSQSVLSPQGQYLLRASMADNGIVAARAKSVTAKWNISMFRFVESEPEKKCKIIMMGTGLGYSISDRS